MRRLRSPNDGEGEDASEQDDATPSEQSSEEDGNASGQEDEPDTAQLIDAGHCH